MKRKNILITLAVLAFGITASVGFAAPSYTGTSSVGAAEQGALF